MAAVSLLKEIEDVMAGVIAKAWPNMHECHYKLCVKRRGDAGIHPGIAWPEICEGCHANMEIK
jgi:hypothetical protein